MIMDIAALVLWLLTAVGGFVMLGTWIAKGGTRSSNFPSPLIFGHFLLAAAGLVIWIIYLFADSKALAWTAFIVLIPVALLGFTMLARWIPTYRSRSVSASGPGTTSAEPAEKHFPVAVVVGHGLLAVATVVLVLVSALSG
jgi:hypothetical protein